MELVLLGCFAGRPLTCWLFLRRFCVVTIWRIDQVRRRPLCRDLEMDRTLPTRLAVEDSIVPQSSKWWGWLLVPIPTCGVPLWLPLTLCVPSSNINRLDCSAWLLRNATCMQPTPKRHIFTSFKLDNWTWAWLRQVWFGRTRGAWAWATGKKELD